jgi:hypothetical protein
MNFDDLYFWMAAATADFTFGMFDISEGLEEMAVVKADAQKQLKGRSCYGHLGGTFRRYAWGTAFYPPFGIGMV